MKFLIYLIRWQLAGVLIYPLFISYFGALWGTFIGNTVGAIVFFQIDRYLTNKKHDTTNN